jgi:hypothetical protein
MCRQLVGRADKLRLIIAGGPGEWGHADDATVDRKAVAARLVPVAAAGAESRNCQVHVGRSVAGLRTRHGLRCRPRVTASAQARWPDVPTWGGWLVSRFPGMRPAARCPKRNCHDPLRELMPV